MKLHLSLFLLLGGIVSPVSGQKTTDIYWIDVEGGAATLIVTPARESILIDSGENKTLHADRIADMAKRAGVKQIDYFIISHWHADHYGGTYEVTKRLPIKRYYANTPPPDRVDDDPQFTSLIALYKKTNPGKTEQLKAGAVIPLKTAPGTPPVKMRILASGRGLVNAVPGAAKNPDCNTSVSAPALDDGENAKSLAALLEYGTFRFFDAGDLTWHIEERLACPINLVGSVDLYQVTHHGLDRSNNPHLLRAVRPLVAVVNNGAQKGAEPNSMRTVLGSPGIEAVWALYANTKSDSKLNAPESHIANKPGSGGQFIKAAVLPDGSFSLQIGDNGTKATYEARAVR
jgi:beta-lactamase superfamily II metal-dependent hydrolase